MKLNILFVDDDDKLRTSLIEIFNEQSIEGHILNATGAQTFEEGITLVSNYDYDIIILDLYQGAPIEGNEKLGLKVLKQIQSVAFIPVIFYSGLTKDIADLESEIVGIVNKGDGIKKLTEEITRIIRSNIALIKGKVYEHIRITLKDYFWNTVHNEKAIIGPIKDDVSIGYLLLRRLAYSLSKENIKILLGDEKIDQEKAHPMEFYIYPSDSGEYEAGEILLKETNYYVTLTPSCDFINTKKGGRKVGQVLLVLATSLKETEELKKYMESKSSGNYNDLARVIESRKGDRYFFLPGTPFIDNHILDFQNKTMVSYDELKTFQRIAKLDMPFAQSMISSFSRYYNRIGFPDIDSDYIIKNM